MPTFPYANSGGLNNNSTTLYPPGSIIGSLPEPHALTQYQIDLHLALGIHQRNG